MESSYHRHYISNAVWSLLESHLLGQRGRGFAQDNPLFDKRGILGYAYRRSLAEFAARLWEAGQRSPEVYSLAQEGLLETLIDKPNYEWLMIDTSHVKVTPSRCRSKRRQSGYG